ncbi:p53-like transcription factor [Hypoxylon fragiforme]|uniref:p53-like transcription factor n=1 Tax=Hypoxylon fragiforme TaxID=63214 RepID=UPI0020C6A95C|nr:p53-like transcription factor [Hypoxylon fragiforme]KAI2613814.1 p53-like transcription factor [Hypoxylon fragiforme]
MVCTLPGPVSACGTRMLYNQDSSISSLTIETPPQPPSVLGGFSAPLLNSNTTTGYSPDTGSFYSPASQIFSGIDVRQPRLGSNSTSSTGMAHANRPTALPTPAYNVRELYSGPSPSFRRAGEHTRSPSFATPLRRLPLSPTPSPSIGFTSPVRMDASQYGKATGSHIPPLLTMTSNGQLSHSDSATPIKIDIHGTIDKGFFMSEGDWTCYRRNYFSCICSYSLTPYYPNSTMQYVPNGSSTSYQVFGFAMSISAVVSDSDSHTIDLVQHTPKRDKGPVQKPEKVRLTPKQPQQTPHPLLYQDHHSMSGGSRPLYEAGYGQSTQGSYPSEHTFERIQFKQATANNGKRRAAQQYYHLVVELYADVGNQAQDQFLKIAQRKSAKMIVRGRSPGHYQTERRGSTSSGPGGQGGMGYPGSQVLGSEYGTGGGSSLLSGSYTGGGGYDTRPGHYGATRHHELPMEPIIPTEDAKAIDNAKEYQYYPSTIYEGTDSRQGVEMFSHRSEPENLMPSAPATVDPTTSKVKHEYEGTLPSIFYNPGSSYYPRNCSRFEGKQTSTGYYPTMPAMLPQSG